MTSAGTWWRTVRHLRVRQWIGRIVFRLRRPRPELRPPPPRRVAAGPWVPAARREPSFDGRGGFRFLGECRTLDMHGWDDAALSHLWRYNLHYFDDLNAHDAAARSPAHQALLIRWIEENPPARGVGWEPYPVSLRIVNWIKAAERGLTFDDRCVGSLAVQARWLAKRMETHLLGNHLFVNAKALMFAGCWFHGREAAGWRHTAAALLAQELDEQVLADGGQFERSPMYHALAVEDMLDLLNLWHRFDDVEGTTVWRQNLARRVPAMLDWLLMMTHPDGSLALFNDAAQGVAPAHGELLRYAQALGIGPANATPLNAPVVHLRESGYLRVTRGPVVALLDIAPIGPDYLPGHAHADTLSFELSHRERRVIVNGGTSCYGTGAQRQRERATAAHSTVEINGQASS
jgi:uncharacterized heparinase superfamily protein